MTRSRGLGVYATWLGLGWGWEAEWADAENFFWSKMHSHNYINAPESGRQRGYFWIIGDMTRKKYTTTKIYDAK